jgi:2-succinyl-6-hydroxy-2,4-cyclohexadiene-1-carboxylate synthase
MDNLYYSAGNTEYWYEVHGQGIPVVLLHGFTGSSATWNSLISNFQYQFQWITVDLPGHGRTKGETIKTMEECIDDLHDLFQVLRLDRFFLLGYSMGGRTALSYAVRYPDTLQGLILESASPGLEDASSREERKANDEALANKIEKEGLTAFVDYWQELPLFDTQKDLPIETQEEIRSDRLRQTEKGLANSLRGMGTGMQPSNWDSLKEVDLPVLLIAGAQDEKFVKINHEMQKKFPEAVLQVIASTGHAVHVEDKESFLQIVVEFAKMQTS